MNYNVINSLKQYLKDKDSKKVKPVLKPHISIDDIEAIIRSRIKGLQNELEEIHSGSYRSDYKEYMAERIGIQINELECIILERLKNTSLKVLK